MTDGRDVAITALGAVTSFGRDVTAFWEALVAGRSAIAPITAFDASSYPCSIAGEVRNYAPHSQLSAEQAARLDRGALFAVDAALQALADANLPLTRETPPQGGLVLGCARPVEPNVGGGARPFTIAMEKNGWGPAPVSNVPASKMVAIPGWSSLPRICASCSKRRSSFGLATPARMTFRATVRRGASCSAS